MLKINSISTLFRMKVNYFNEDVQKSILVDVDFQNREVIFSDEDKQNLGVLEKEISESILDYLMPEVAESPEMPVDLLRQMNEMKIVYTGR